MCVCDSSFVHSFIRCAIKSSVSWLVFISNHFLDITSFENWKNLLFEYISVSPGLSPNLTELQLIGKSVSDSLFYVVVT